LNFSHRAETYAENASVQRDAAKWLAEWIDCEILPSESVIELGAGTGFLTKKLLEKNLSVTATDISPEMVEHGKRACPEATWKICDGWKLPVNAFDWIFSSSLLQWMPRPKETLKGFYNALRRGGKMLHGFFVSPTLAELYSLAARDFFPLRWRTEAEWIENFEQTGFRILRSETNAVRVIYPNAKAFLRRLHDSGVTAVSDKKMPTGTLRKLLRDYEENFSAPEIGVPTVYATWNFLRVELGKE